MQLAILHSGDLEKVSVGGIDRYVKSLIEYFENDEITVYGTGHAGEVTIGKRYIREYHGKRYCFVPITVDDRKPLSIYYMLQEFKWIKKLSEYDCVYAQRTEYSIPFIFRKSAKLIQIIHGSSKYSKIGFGSKKAIVHLALEKMAISIATKTFVILNREEFGVPYYQKRYKKYAKRIAYARNLINPEIYYPRDRLTCRKELRLPIDRELIIFVGRLEDRSKRVLLLPKVCRKIVELGYQYDFIIVGDGPDKEKMEQLVDDLNVRDYFKFVGYVDDRGLIAQYYCAGNLAINVSAFEGTCTSNLEALSCGIPLVSTDVGDIREVLDGNHNGIIVPCEEDEVILIDKIAHAVIDVINNKPPMNKAYMKYYGKEVARDLREVICQLKS